MWKIFGQFNYLRVSHLVTQNMLALQKKFHCILQVQVVCIADASE